MHFRSLIQLGLGVLIASLLPSLYLAQDVVLISIGAGEEPFFSAAVADQYSHYAPKQLPMDAKKRGDIQAVIGMLNDWKKEKNVGFLMNSQDEFRMESRISFPTF